jgi:peroxiredoxin
MVRLPMLMVLSALIVASSRAGEFNVVLNIGDKAPAWVDLPGVDGKQHSLADLKDKEVVVVAFTCNSCPFAVDYEDRLIALAKKYAGPEGKVAVVAINVNKIPEDSFSKMQERAKAKAFPYPYLYDETQKIAREYGANFTPEFFVLTKDRRIAYMGGMDDNSNAQLVTKNFLEPAVEAALQGSRPSVAESPARGCRIRYVREREKK